MELVGRFLKTVMFGVISFMVTSILAIGVPISVMIDTAMDRDPNDEDTVCNKFIDWYNEFISIN